MRKLAATVVGMAMWAAPATASADPGDVDPSFGTAGLFESTVGDRDSSGRVVAGAAGALYLVGSSSTNNGDLIGPSRTAITKTSADGALDTGFGTNGAATFIDGMPMPAGRPALWGSRIAIADDDGVSSFSDAGADPRHVAIALAEGTAQAQAVAADGTGLLVAGTYYDAGFTTLGAFVARLSADGTRDAAFGPVLLPGFTSVTDAVRTADGGLYVVGEATGPAVRVVRVTPAGAADGAYGTSGAFESTLGAPSAGAGQAALDADGRLLVAARLGAGAQNLSTIRLTAAGALDAAYGTGGIARIDVADGVDSLPAGALTLDPQGRAVVASTATRFSPFSVSAAVARFTTGGQPDATFSSSGAALPSFAAGVDQTIYGVLVQPSGRIVLAGQISRSSGGGRSTMMLGALQGGSRALGAAPDVRITQPAQGGAIGDQAPTFSGTVGTAAGDVADVTLELRPLVDGTPGAPIAVPDPAVDGGAWSTAMADKLASGRYRLTVTQPSSDGRGTGTDTVDFKVDRIAPVPAITVPAADGTAGTSITIEGTRGTQGDDALNVPDQPAVTLERCRQPASGAPVCADIPTQSLSASTWQAKPAGEGTYTVRARQEDDLGNVGRSTRTLTYKVDATAPSLTVTAPAAAKRLADATPRLGGAAGALADDNDHVADETSVSVSLVHGDATSEGPAVSAPVAGGAWTVDWPRALREDVYQATIRQRDALGNTTTRQRTFTVDLTAPAVTVTRADGQAVGGGLGTAAGDVADVDVVIRDADGDQVAAPDAALGGDAWSAPVPRELPTGDYSVEVTQRDDAGNVASPKVAFHIERDTTPPRPAIRLTANSGDLVNMEIERGAEPGDVEQVRYRLERVDVPGVVTDQLIDLPAPRRFYQLSVTGPPGVYEAEVLQDDIWGNHGSSGKLRFTKTPGGFDGVVQTDPVGSLPAGFTPSREVPTDAAGRVPDVRGDALDVAADRIRRTFKQVTVRFTPKTASERSLGKRPGGGSWRVGDVIAQDPKPNASFTTSLGEEDTARLTFWAGEAGGGGADCRELRRTLRGDDLQTGLAQLRAARCAPPDIEIRPSRGTGDPTIKRVDRDGDVLVTYPTSARNLDLIVWKGYGPTSTDNPGPSEEDFALTAGVANVAGLQVFGRGIDDEGRPQLMKGARVKFDMHEVGGVDKTATTDSAGRVAIGGLKPKRRGLVHVQVEWSDRAGERIYGYTAFRVVERCGTSGFRTIIGEQWRKVDVKGPGCRFVKGAPRSGRAAGIGDWIGFIREALAGLGQSVAQTVEAGREGVVRAFTSFRTTAMQLMQNVQSTTTRLAEAQHVDSGLWRITAAGVVSAGGGNVVSAGGANVVAAGGGNLLAGKGGQVVAAGGGNVVSAGGGNILLLPDGSHVVSAGGGNVVSAGGGNVVSPGGANVVSAGGGN